MNRNLDIINMTVEKYVDNVHKNTSNRFRKWKMTLEEFENKKRKYLACSELIFSLIFLLMCILVIILTDDTDRPFSDLPYGVAKLLFWLYTIFWPGFGICGLYLILTKEPKPKAITKKLSPTDIEKDMKSWFVKVHCLIILAITLRILIKCFTMHWSLHLILHLGSLISFALFIILLDTKKCPNCGHRILYQLSFKYTPFAFLPEYCKSCGVVFRWRRRYIHPTFSAQIQPSIFSRIVTSYR